jgi:hypothetical protein
VRVKVVPRLEVRRSRNRQVGSLTKALMETMSGNLKSDASSFLLTAASFTSSFKPRGWAKRHLKVR